MMNKLTQLLFFTLLICLPASLIAQENDYNEDSRYLVGAVPEVGGKVVFSREFSIPGMSQQQIFERMEKWLAQRLKANDNIESRIVYTDVEKGTIAGIGEEWLVFKSSALSLDRALLNYQVTIKCEPARCVVSLEKIRYTYREKEKYTAEEWITDKYALNKTQTKLVRGLSKWRKKTVDFSDNLFAEATQALSTTTLPKNDNTSSKQAIPSGKVVIGSTAPMTPLEPATKINKEDETIAATTPLKPVNPDQVPASDIQMGSGKLVITIGSDAFNMTMMTANAGGSLGNISGTPVIFSILSPDQPYESLEKAETYTVRFYPTNQSEPSVILECKKLPVAAPLEGQPRTYAGEILKAWMK